MYYTDEEAAAMSQQPPMVSPKLAQALAYQQMARGMSQANLLGMDGRTNPGTGPKVETVSHTTPTQGAGTGVNYYPPAPGSESLGTATSEHFYPGMDINTFPDAPDPHQSPTFNGGPGADGLSPYGRKAVRHSPDLARALMNRKGGLY